MWSVICSNLDVDYCSICWYQFMQWHKYWTVRQYKYRFVFVSSTLFERENEIHQMKNMMTPHAHCAFCCEQREKNTDDGQKKYKQIATLVKRECKTKTQTTLRNDRLWIGPTKQRENAHIYFAEFFFRHIFAIFFLFSVFFLLMLCVLRICTNNVCQNNS